MRSPLTFFRLPGLGRGLGLLPILAGTVVLAPLLPVPLTSIRWHGLQSVAVEVGGVVLLVGLLCRPWFKSALPSLFHAPTLRQVSLLCLHLLLLWTLASCVQDPNPFAVQSLLTLAGGVLVLDTAALQTTDQRRLLFVVNALSLAGVLVCGAGLVALGSTEAQSASGPLHDHQLFGAFMIIPLLLSGSASLGGGTQAQRLLSQAALLLCLAGLWESQDRSAWLGLAASGVVFAALAVLTAGPKAGVKAARRPAALSALLLVGAVSGMALLSPNRDAVLARLQTLAHAPSSRYDSRVWREQVWAGTRQMIAKHPLTGWGAGSFPPAHAPFTRTGHSADAVDAAGPSIEDEAHNSYLQLWAELGIIGLLLWLGALGAFLVFGVRALTLYPARSLQQWVLIGCLAAIAGQAVDALANPAWQFPQVALPLWIVFGLTAALSRPAAGTEKHKRKSVALAARLGQSALAVGVGGWPAVADLPHGVRPARPAPLDLPQSAPEPSAACGVGTHMAILVSIGAAALGLFLIGLIVWEGFETIILPRSVTRSLRVTRGFYKLLWPITQRAARRVSDERRDLFLAYFGPLSLPLLLVLWAVGLVFGFALLQWALPHGLVRVLGMNRFSTALYQSGVTFFTLGYGDVTPRTNISRFVAVMEAGIGFAFLAVVIGYLPVLYQAFSQREAIISLLDSRAGSPPSATEMLRRHAEARQMDRLLPLMRDWEVWASEQLESHLSYPVLTYYRSQHDHQSWLGALTAIMDTCTLLAVGAAGDPERQRALQWQARLTFAMCRHMVVDLAYIFNLPPKPLHPDRLPPVDLAALRGILASAGLPLCDGPGGRHKDAGDARVV